MDRLSFLGGTTFLSYYAMLVSISTESFDLDKLLESGGKEGFNSQIYKEEGLEEKMGADIMDFIQKFCIDNNVV